MTRALLKYSCISRVDNGAGWGANLFPFGRWDPGISRPSGINQFHKTNDFSSRTNYPSRLFVKKKKKTASISKPIGLAISAAKSIDPEIRLAVIGARQSSTPPRVNGHTLERRAGRLIDPGTL